MAKTYYAWADIKAGTLEKPLVVSRGAKVTAGGLGITDTQFNHMIEAGSIKDKAFPAPDGYQGSAIDWWRDQLAEATDSSALDEAEVGSELSALETVSS